MILFFFNKEKNKMKKGYSKCIYFEYDIRFDDNILIYFK